MARKQRPWTIRPADFFTEVEEVKAAFADVLGTPQREQVAVLPSVSYGMAIVARNLPFRPGQHIVVAGEQFPSNVHPWRRLADTRRRGARRGPTRQRDGRAAAWNDALHDAIDERTAMLAIGARALGRWHAIRPAAARRAGARGRRVGGDRWHAVGWRARLSVRRGPSRCGDVCRLQVVDGAVRLRARVVRRVLQDGEPLEETWAGRRGSEDFRGLADYTDAYGPGSVRFDVGQRSNFITLPMAIEALRLVKEWGPDASRRTVRRCGRRAGAAREAGYAIEDAAWRGHHLVGVRPPRGADRRPWRRASPRQRARLVARDVDSRVAAPVQHARGHAGAHGRADGRCVIA